MFTCLHFYIFNPVTILGDNTPVRSGYVLCQYQHSVRVCVPHNEAKLGLVSPKGANQTQQADYPFVSAFSPQKMPKNAPKSVSANKILAAETVSAIKFLAAETVSANKTHLSDILAHPDVGQID